MSQNILLCLRNKQQLLNHHPYFEANYHVSDAIVSEWSGYINRLIDEQTKMRVDSYRIIIAYEHIFQIIWLHEILQISVCNS